MNIASETAKAMLKLEMPKTAKTITPDKADKICPNKIFFGCARGLSWTAITRTMLAPNGGMSQKSPS
jgi:hypothetical protein